MVDLEVWIVELKPIGDGPPMRIRMRHALKALLRAHGVKAVAVRGRDERDKLLDSLAERVAAQAALLARRAEGGRTRETS